MTIENKIADKSATELGQGIAAGHLKSQEVTAYFIEQIKTHNPKLNAVITDRFETAMEEAKTADQDAQNGNIKGALHGVPMTVKDAFEVKGLSCVVGNPQFSNYISERDAAVVQKLQAAGAIILGKTNTPFLCADWQSYNEVYGTSNNPHNIDHTPGGSSGGSAAALAAGMTPLEYGSDIGGSIRLPAHYCGLFGHKPTFGIISKDGHVPPPHGALSEQDLSVVGPLARNTQDLELAFDLTIGLDAPQNNAVQLNLPAARKTSPQGLRIGVWADDPYCEVDSEIKSAIETAAQKLEAEGAEIINMRPDFSLAEHQEVYMMMLSPIMASGFPEEAQQQLRELAEAAAPEDKSFNILQARGSQLLHRDWILWNEMRGKISAAWAQYFKSVDVIFCPITPTSAMPHDHSPFNARQIKVNDQPREYSDNIIWAGMSILCGLPSTATPLGRDKNSLPFGMQIIGAAYEDKTTIAVARMLENIGYGFQKPSGY